MRGQVERDFPYPVLLRTSLSAKCCLPGLSGVEEKALAGFTCPQAGRGADRRSREHFAYRTRLVGWVAGEPACRCS